jgi:hypothetical protein
VSPPEELRLPPGLFGPPPPELTAEQQAAQEALVKRAEEIDLELRARVRFFEAVICGCSFFRDREDPGRPAQVGCHIHGSITLDRHGRVI